MEELLVNIEGPILLWIQEYIRNDFLTPVMTAVTHLGDSGWFWIVCAAVCLAFTRTRSVGLRMSVAMLLNLLVTNLFLKRVVARTRPYIALEELDRIIEAQSDYSFPSGHTACSFAAAVVIFMMCPRKIGVPALLLAVLISLSRLYVGVHFPTDVIGGALAGAASALLAGWICKKLGQDKAFV